MLDNLVKIPSVCKRGQEGKSTERSICGKGWMITSTLSWLRSMCTYSVSVSGDCIIQDYEAPGQRIQELGGV